MDQGRRTGSFWRCPSSPFVAVSERRSSAASSSLSVGVVRVVVFAGALVFVAASLLVRAAVTGVALRPLDAALIGSGRWTERQRHQIDRRTTTAERVSRCGSPVVPERSEPGARAIEIAGASQVA